MSDEERQRTAYHESGHALVGMLTPGADPVRKISIIPAARRSASRSRPRKAIATATAATSCSRRSRSRSAAGRPSSVIYGAITTGAESDIQQLTKIARGMVERWA